MLAFCKLHLTKQLEIYFISRLSLIVQHQQVLWKVLLNKAEKKFFLELLL